MHDTDNTSISPEARLRALRNRTLLAEVWGFLRERKAWWLLPTVLMLVSIGGLIVLANSSAISSYIYMLF